MKNIVGKVAGFCCSMMLLALLAAPSTSQAYQIWAVANGDPGAGAQGTQLVIPTGGIVVVDVWFDTDGFQNGGISMLLTSAGGYIISGSDANRTSSNTGSGSTNTPTGPGFAGYNYTQNACFGPCEIGAFKLLEITLDLTTALASEIVLAVNLGSTNMFNADTFGTDFATGVADAGIAAPEPGTALLLGFGLMGVAAMGRKRRHEA